MDVAAQPNPQTLGEFRVIAVLGQGGSGIVYDATWGPRRVALKVLHPNLVGTERVRAQFLTEAARLQQISHASVVKVLAVGELPDGRPYLAMERLEGETLASVLGRGAVPLPLALGWFEELADAVGALHAKGLVHRDLKPENVFVVNGQHAVLLDFGITKEVDAQPSTTTIDGGVRGTPAYMAPERFFGQPAGVATDIYELAVTLYAMLAGRLPWDDLADPEARLSPRPLVEFAAVPAELDIEIRRALSTRAQNRPASALALREAVRTSIGGEASAASSTARMRPAGDPASAETGAVSPKPWFAERQATTDRGKTPLAWAPTEAAPKLPPPKPRRRAPFIAAAIGVALLGGSLGWWRLSKQATPLPALGSAPGSGDTQPVREFAADDPWNAPPKPPKPIEQPLLAAIPVAGKELTAAAARAELVAGIAHVPVDTQVLFAAVVGDLRRNQQYAKILENLEKQPRVVELMQLIPCLKPIITGSEWFVFAARSLEDGHHGTLIVRGRWQRKNIEACFGHDIDPLKMQDGKTILQLKHLGWVDFVDDHTVYLSVREDLAAAQVHDLAVKGKGPTKRTKELLAKLPAERSITAVVDGTDMPWPENHLPRGSDVTAWLRIEDDATTLDLFVDPHSDIEAAKLVASIKPEVDTVFKDVPEALGKLAVSRDKTTMRITGEFGSIMMGIITAQIIASM